MKGDDAASEMKQMWESGQIRVLILISLTIQAVLTFVAPLRKNQSKTCVKLIIWILYLLADVIAIYIIGLIQSSRGHHFAQKPELLAFWASFLLLHLGGPDTITALALEDNELWRRHALQLTSQVAITIYVFIRSLRHANPLWLPTILMFFDGFIKYFERTCALFFASRDNFRESLMRPAEAGPNYARLMEEFYAAKTAHIPTEFEGKDDLGKVRAAAGDGQQSTNEDRSLQRNSSALDWPQRKGEKNTDAIITYILFVGAIALDISAASMFVFSDWWVIITYTTNIEWLTRIMSTILRWPRYFRKMPQSKRWSQKISSYNLLHYCFHERPFNHFVTNIRMKMIKDFIIRWEYVESKDV